MIPGLDRSVMENNRDLSIGEKSNNIFTFFDF
jgi:hypothetical protein